MIGKAAEVLALPGSFHLREKDWWKHGLIVPI